MLKIYCKKIFIEIKKQTSKSNFTDLNSKENSLLLALMVEENYIYILLKNNLLSVFDLNKFRYQSSINGKN